MVTADQIWKCLRDALAAIRVLLNVKKKQILVDEENFAAFCLLVRNSIQAETTASSQPQMWNRAVFAVQWFGAK